jgi:16S rRNA processing protein RimM
MEFFALGKVIKTRGLHGCLKVMSYAQKQDVFDGLKHIFVEKSPGEKKEYQVEKIEISGKFLFIQLHEINDLDTAASLVGCSIFLPKELLPPLPEDEYYWSDIIGLEVVSQDGKILGKIESIFSTGSNDVYVCKDGKRETLIPAITDVIDKIDLKNGFMKVKLPKGL